MVERNRNTQQERVGYRLREAVRLGEIQKPGNCERCGKHATGRALHGHHHNGYDEAHALDVVWLCGSCHNREHTSVIATAAIRSRFTAEEIRVMNSKAGRKGGQKVGRTYMTRLSPEKRSDLARRAALASVVKRRTEKNHAIFMDGAVLGFF